MAEPAPGQAIGGATGEAIDPIGRVAGRREVDPAELEASLEVALAAARAELSLVRASLASVTAFLTRPER